MSDNINIWAEITKTPRPYSVVPFPKLNPATGESFCDVAIVMMTAEESALVTRDADIKARKLLKEGTAGSLELSLGYEELYKRYTAEGIVFNTVRNADDVGLRFFPRREDIFKVLTVDEVSLNVNNNFAHLAPRLMKIIYIYQRTFSKHQHASNFAPFPYFYLCRYQSGHDNSDK